MTTVHDIRQKFADILSAFFDFLKKNDDINTKLTDIDHSLRESENKAEILRTLQEIDYL